MRRRDFLKLTASATAGTIIFQACDFSDWGDGSPASEFKVQSPRDIQEDYLFGNDAWYATVFPNTPDAAGVVVRVFEGRAKKIEGNPNHPVNRGRLTARGQAMLQDLYHPDRVRTPMRRVGGRGSGQYEPMRWDDAINELVNALGNTPGEQVVMLTEPLSGAHRQVVDRFVNGIGATRHAYQTLEQRNVREAVQRVFGSDQLPTFDIANAQYVLSVGADWLHTWISPVQFSQGFAGLRRNTAESPRGKLTQIESRLSGTAAVADQWVPVQPGYEGLVALAIAGVIIDEGLAADTGAFEQVVGSANLPSPEDAAAWTGVAADTLREIARQFAEAGSSLAIGGGSAAAHTNGTANMTAVYALNLLVGNVNQPGGVWLNSPLDGDLQELVPDVPATAGELQQLIQSINDGNVSTLLIHEANPVYGLPQRFDLETALFGIDTIFSFSRYIDETSAFADFILPDHVPLESWGSVVPDPQPGYPTIGIQQPVVLRFYDTFQFGDVLLTAAEELGLGEDLPWATMEEVVREQAETLRNLAPGNIASTGDATAFWTELLQTGVWMNQEAQGSASAGEPAGSLPDALEPQYAGDAGEYPFYLVPFESVSLGAGEFAHLPWMQSLPDPITTVAWASWAELNPETAKELDVGIGDYIRVSSPAGELDVRVYVNPATPPNVVAIPMGQGHSFSGRYAEGRGINVLDLVEPQFDSETGSLAWAGTRVQARRVGTYEKLPRMEGSVKAEAPEDYEIIRRTREPGNE